MTNKPNLYLAGKMSGLTWDDQNGWRDKADSMLNKFFITINPCKYYAFKTGRPLNSSEFVDTEKEVKEFDLWAVEHSEIIMVNLDYPDSIGTAIELHMAHDVWHKPVIAFGGKDVYIHPWIELSLTKRCETLEDAVDHIKRFYLKHI